MINYTVQKSDMQKISQQTQDNDLGYFKFAKIFISYVVVATIFSGLSEDALRYSPETVAWCASKTLVVLKYATMCAAAIHTIWLRHSASLSSRQTLKSIPLEKEIEALRAENIRLRQELTARQKVIKEPTLSVFTRLKCKIFA